MSPLPPALGTSMAAARRRRVLIAIALGLPPLVALVGSIEMLDRPALALAVAIAGTVAIALVARRASARLDAPTFARRLDAADRGLEDSAGLAFADRASLGALPALQRDRVLARIAAGPAPDLRDAWPRRAIAASVAIAVLVVGAALALRFRAPERVAPVETPAAAAVVGATHIDRARLEIVPPAYTGLAPSIEPALEAKVPRGATVRWRVHLDAEADAVELRFHDRTRLALARDGGDWTGERAFEAAALYRVAVVGALPLADDRNHRLELVDDQPPQVRVIEPEKTLTLLANAQKQWALELEASDDYGVASASLEITLAQGTGENITVKRQSVPLRGSGGPRLMRYRYVIDLAALGVAAGDDVIARVTVVDNRPKAPQSARSPSYILRWPPEAATEASGVEGIVQTALPAYFRSQRQIIIDTEALIAERSKLTPEKLLDRSDSIGVDQKVLRLRYGRFLGEESESHTGPHAPGAGAHHDDEHHDDQRHDDERAAGAGDDTPAPKGFGEAGDVLAEFGHTHDQSEAATLLDPETRRVLKLALEQMWQAELELRLGKPETALPPENRALEYIKQVQQANRIYLARVGVELPPFDPTRRLTGERKGLADRAGGPTARDTDDVPARLWLALQSHAAPPLDATTTWLGAHADDVPDALALGAALDELGAKPDCASCREELARLVWPLLSRPATATTLRAAPDAAGRAYLDALKEPSP